MDESSKLITTNDVIKEVYKAHPFPMWLVEKVVDTFFALIVEHMMKGDYIYIKGFGAIVPYKRVKGHKGFPGYDPTVIRTRYKMKLSPYLTSKIAEKTQRRNDVQGS